MMNDLFLVLKMKPKSVQVIYVSLLQKITQIQK